MINLTNITKKYTDKVVFDNLSISFEENTTTCILGSSGCGKTTLLNIICKLTDFEGEINYNKNPSYIFQEPRLIPSLNIYKNLEYVIRKKITDKNQRKSLIENILLKLKIEDTIKKYPHQLSGGMAQRVSIARAFIYPSDLILMDEPFKGLDISLKKHIIEHFENLLLNNKKTVIFITHDIEEALKLGNRIVVLSAEGKIILDSAVEKEPQKQEQLRKEIYNIL